MKIQKNTDVQFNPSQNQESAAASGAARLDAGTSGKAGMSKGNVTSVSGANLKGESLIQQRQGLAKKQALKVVSDAFAGEKKLDAQMQSIKDEIKRLQDEINEKSAMLGDNNARIKELQEEFGVDPESDAATWPEEYKESVSDLLAQNKMLARDIDQYKAIQAGNVQGFSDMKRERLKSQDMLKAQEAAEDIMDAAYGETIALLTKEAVEHVDEEQEERKEAAKEILEKRKEEKKEEAKKLEKEAMQQEMIENIREHAAQGQRTGADIKRAEARRERSEAERMDAEGMQKTIITDASSMEDTQDAVNTEIAKILGKLSLLSSDVLGSSIDDQI